MDLQLTVGESAEALIRDLHAWLAAEDGPWGPVRIREREPLPETLGPVADAVELVIGSVGALTSLAAVIVAWLQYRKPDVTITITTESGGERTDVPARQAQVDDVAARAALAAWLTDAFDAAPDGEGGGEDAD